METKGLFVACSELMFELDVPGVLDGNVTHGILEGLELAEVITPPGYEEPVRVTQ